MFVFSSILFTFILIIFVIVFYTIYLHHSDPTLNWKNVIDQIQNNENKWWNLTVSIPIPPQNTLHTLNAEYSFNNITYESAPIDSMNLKAGEYGYIYVTIKNPKTKKINFSNMRSKWYKKSDDPTTLIIKAGSEPLYLRYESNGLFHAIFKDSYGDLIGTMYLSNVTAEESL
jgi:hypothetical protein